MINNKGYFYYILNIYIIKEVLNVIVSNIEIYIFNDFNF